MRNHLTFKTAIEIMMASRIRMNDPKAWAHRILENKALYPEISVKFAKIALSKK